MVRISTFLRSAYRFYLGRLRVTRARLRVKREKAWRAVSASLKELGDNFRFIRLKPLMLVAAQLPDFPSSDGPDKQKLEVALMGAMLGYKKVGQLRELSEVNEYLRVVELSTLNLVSEGAELASKLAQLFTAEGSDKSNPNRYEKIYAYIFQELNFKVGCIGEIGIGTNNQDVLSHMGSSGKPGASLRAWRDAFGSGVRVIGFDIDERVLFSERGIETFYLNQMDELTFQPIDGYLGEQKFDVFIDDGLHAPVANLNFLIYGSRFVKDGGFLVVEDIALHSLSFWELVASNFPKSWEPLIIRASNSYVFVVRKTGKTILEKGGS